jgi:DNA-binding beta-propeller fold protein YncE
LKEPLVVALDDRRYEIERPWAAQPSTFGSGWMTDLAIDHADRLYVLNRFDRYVDPPGKPAVAVYSSEGVLEQTFELPDLTDGHGISIGPNGEIIVVDRDRHVVHVLDQNGQELLTLGERNEPGRPFSHPTCARIAPGGDIFVCDGYGNSKIHRFSPSGQLIKSWGEPGSGPGQFTTPHCLAYTRAGEIAVCDRENNRVQLFNFEGAFLREIKDVFHPMAIEVDPEDMLLISDQIPRLSMVTSAGKLIGRCRPALYGGHGMSLDSAGNIYFSELRLNRVSRLKRIE